MRREIALAATLAPRDRPTPAAAPASAPAPEPASPPCLPGSGDDPSTEPSLDSLPAIEIEEPSLILPPAHSGASHRAGREGGRVFERGSTVGRYVVLDLVGSGGMGEVYGAYDPELDRRVALKVLRPRRLSRRDAHLARARLVREAQSMARLAHPNVISVYDVGTVDGDVYFAMEYVDGVHLAGWLGAERRDYRKILKTFLAAARGLRAAHAVGLVHRDFKPHNVLVGRLGQVRVIDFGLAHQTRELPNDARELAPAGPTLPRGPRARASQASPLLPESAAPTPPLRAPLRRMAADVHTLAGTVVGTPAYMAPEQFRGRPADARSDQFSFCVALYEALYGRLPFEGETVEELMANVARGALRPPAQSCRVPVWLEAAVLRGLHTDPAQRHRSMQGLLEALTPVRPPRWDWRLPAAVGAALVVAVLGVASLVHVLRPAPTPRGLCASSEAPAGLDLPHRRQALRSVLGAAAVGGGGRLAAATLTRLDAWSRRWEAARSQACAPRDPPAEPAATAPALECLELAAASLEGTVTAFVSADTRLALQAPALVEALPDPAACVAPRGPEAARVLLPDTPVGRQQALSGWAELAAVAALAAGHRDREALARLRPLADSSQTPEWAPLRARALLLLARLEARSGDVASATERLFQAVRLASSSEAKGEEALAWLGLAQLYSARLGRPAEAQRWVKHARVALAGAPEHRWLQPQLLTTAAVAQRAQGDLEGALMGLRRAQQLLEGLDGAARPLTAAHLEGEIAATLLALGRTSEALGHVARALDPVEAELGPEHPSLAPLLELRGQALAGLGRRAAARTALERAQAIVRPTSAEGTGRRAAAQRTLARLDAQEGHPERAVGRLLVLLEREEARGADPAHLLGVRTEVATLLVDHGRGAEARGHLERVVATCSGPAPSWAASAVDCVLAQASFCRLDVLTAPGPLAEARCLRAVEAATRLGPRGATAAALARRALARQRVAEHRPAEAYALLELARAGLEAQPGVGGTPGAPAARLLALVRFDLARALWPASPERSLHLAELARAGLARAEASSGRWRSEVAQWLTSRRRATQLAMD